MLKYLLLPFSWIFGFIAWIRNTLYNRGIFNSYHSKLPSIVIGNLQVGGSGKTPMTAYLYKMFSGSRRIAILSRGYGRKSSGLIELNKDSKSVQVGDEPLWYYRNLKAARVVVSESRKKGLQYLEKTDSELVLLDDAFQHRAIKSDIYILLSDYAHPYYKDYPLPFGRMREYRTGDKRADIIIVSKCPDELSLIKKVEIIKAINPLDHQDVFFTGLKPGTPLPLKGNKPFEVKDFKGILALSGIAHPASFHRFTERFGLPVRNKVFRDHHAYSVNEIREISQNLNGYALICTEKDAIKLSETELLSELPENTCYALPAEPYFLFNESRRFEELLAKKLRTLSSGLHSETT